MKKIRACKRCETRKKNLTFFVVKRHFLAKSLNIFIYLSLSLFIFWFRKKSRLSLIPGKQKSDRRTFFSSSQSILSNCCCLSINLTHTQTQKIILFFFYENKKKINVAPFLSSHPLPCSVIFFYTLCFDRIQQFSFWFEKTKFSTLLFCSLSPSHPPTPKLVLSLPRPFHKHL